MEFIKHLVTGIDGKTYDPSRVLWILGTIVFLIFTGYEVYKTQHFNMTDFGIAYGAILALGASGVKIKETTEPKE